MEKKETNISANLGPCGRHQIITDTCSLRRLETKVVTLEVQYEIEPDLHERGKHSQDNCSHGPLPRRYGRPQRSLANRASKHAHERGEWHGGVDVNGKLVLCAKDMMAPNLKQPRVDYILRVRLR